MTACYVYGKKIDDDHLFANRVKRSKVRPFGEGPLCLRCGIPLGTIQAETLEDELQNVQPVHMILVLDNDTVVTKTFVTLKMGLDWLKNNHPRLFKPDVFVSMNTGWVQRGTDYYYAIFQEVEEVKT